MVVKYIGYHENGYKIQKKSIHEVIFKIKIYIMKSTKEMANSSNIWSDWQDVIQNKNRERIISIIYIFRKICKLLRVGNYKSIELSKNKYINN